MKIFLLSLFIFFGLRMPQAQATLFFYTDQLVNGFQDWSWAARSLTNTTPVDSGNEIHSGHREFLGSVFCLSSAV